MCSTCSRKASLELLKDWFQAALGRDNGAGTEFAYSIFEWHANKMFCRRGQGRKYRASCSTIVGRSRGMARSQAIHSQSRVEPNKVTTCDCGAVKVRGYRAGAFIGMGQSRRGCKQQYAKWPMLSVVARSHSAIPSLKHAWVLRSIGLVRRWRCRVNQDFPVPDTRKCPLAPVTLSPGHFPYAIVERIRNVQISCCIDRHSHRIVQIRSLHRATIPA